MAKEKGLITLYCYIGMIITKALGFLLIALGVSGSIMATPLNLLIYAAVWTALAYIFRRKNVSKNLPNTLFSLSFTWLINLFIYDLILKLSIPHTARLSLREFFITQQPWSLLIYIVVFLSPFIANAIYLKTASSEQLRGKRVVVIGSGIGGLTAAIYAAKAGFDTELYEQHTIVGGECTGWDRKGYHIDNCIHWMMGAVPGTELNRLWQETAAIPAGFKMHRADRMYTSEHEGRELSLWHDIDRAEKEMIAASPADKAEIRALMDSCRRAQKVFIPAEIPSELMGIGDLMKTGRTSKDSLGLFKEYSGMNMQDLMDKFKDPLIASLISDFTPAESKAHSFPMAYGNFVSGDGGIPDGGSRAMALRMKERFEALGGKVFTGKGVKQIVVSGKRATGILLSDGSEVKCDYVIPACDASVTFGTLLDRSYIYPLMREMFQNRKAYPVYNTFQTAIAVDYDRDLFPAERSWSDETLKFVSGYADRITVKSYSYEPSFAPEGKQIIQTLQGGSEELYEFWTELYKDKEAYKAKKAEFAAITIAAVERRFPELAGHLTLLDAWTPITYSRYCSAFKGFYQSCMITKDSAKLPYPSAYIDGLENVVLAGQWINPPGGLPGAAISGKFAAQRILNLEHANYRL